MVYETVELTQKEKLLIDKLAGMLELSEERFYVVTKNDKKRVKDIFEALHELRKENVKVAEVETRAGVVVVIDKDLNTCFCDDYVLADSLCRSPCSRILQVHPCNYRETEFFGNTQ